MSVTGEERQRFSVLLSRHLSLCTAESLSLPRVTPDPPYLTGRVLRVPYVHPTERDEQSEDVNVGWEETVILLRLDG